MELWYVMTVGENYMGRFYYSRVIKSVKFTTDEMINQSSKIKQLDGEIRALQMSRPGMNSVMFFAVNPDMTFLENPEEK